MDCSNSENATNVSHPESTAEILIWIALFIVMIVLGAYFLRTAEELTGQKSIAKIMLLAGAFIGTMLARGLLWLYRRMATPKASPPESATPAE